MPLHPKLLSAMSILALLAACSNDDSSTDTDDSDDNNLPVLTAWIPGDGTVSIIGGGDLVNVQSVSEATVDDVRYARVQATGIPDYSFELTQSQMAFLLSRPNAATDFVTGTPSVKVGDRVPYGYDIGYASNDTDDGCEANEGYGYWPPGPVCPEDTGKDAYFPIEPGVTTTSCETQLGVIGYALNGVSIYNWWDGAAAGTDVWYTLAAKAELYDVDLCSGHAAEGDYHHHMYSTCLADAVGEDFKGHSELYGYGADGYPIYGPWQDTDVVAQSCWKTRDYSSVETGCSDGTRSCVLIDQYDPGKGTEPAEQGYGFDDTYTSMSGNDFTTINGFFFEDYYYDADCTEQGEEYLDEHNGHSHGDYGYHYHLTIDESGDAVFPFTFGPEYYGELNDNAISECGGDSDS